MTIIETIRLPPGAARKTPVWAEKTVLYEPSFYFPLFNSTAFFSGLSALHEYTQTRSVVVRTDDSSFDWFEQPSARYS
jgi:hypothetical protein